MALLPASEEGLESTIFCSEGLQLYLESEAKDSEVFLVGQAIVNPPNVSHIASNKRDPQAYTG
jgi:hypothetical protein